MPKLPSNRVPSYRLHRASRQGVVTLDGKDHYFGPYEPENKPGPGRAAYSQLTGEWLAAGRKLPGADAPERVARADAGKGRLTVSQLVLLYWRHAQVYYRKGGKPTSEQSCIKLAMRPLNRLYGRTPAADFAPRALKDVRQTMVDAKLERKSINRHVGRIRRMFKWASEDEFVPTVVFHTLQTVQGLKSGRSNARETRPVQPVPDAHVSAIESYVSRQVWAMVRLQTLTGMRGGEVTTMRASCIDMTGRLWLYQPESHKTEHHNQERVIELGARAQKTVRQFLTTDTTAYLFSPRDACAERFAACENHRHQPVALPRTSRHVGARYTPGSLFLLHGRLFFGLVCACFVAL